MTHQAKNSPSTPSTQFIPGLVLLFILTALAPLQVHAQELSNIGKKPPLEVNGGLSLNQVFFHTGDTLSNRDAYAYTLMGNMNFSLYGWSIPVSLTYSNQQWSYQQPFNQFSLHPSYKWIRTHIGYANMSFSPYTLNGHQFLGGGVELTPEGNFEFAAMGGRLQKRILPDSSGSISPSFLRYGGGAKVGYNTAFGNFGANVFYAKDDPSSVPQELDSLGVLPQSNIAVGLSANFRIMKKLNIVVDYGLSHMTENQRSEYTEAGGDILKPRESTFNYHAIKTNLSYTAGFGAFGFGFERIDPGYKTLGAYYNTNDFINYTLNYSGGLFENRVTLSASGGLQYDDLEGQKDQKTSRKVGNVAVGFTPSQKLSLNAMYSNFTNFTNVKTGFENINNPSPYGNLDTLDFTQISETFTLAGNYNFGSAEKLMHSVNLTGTYQKASQKQSDNPSHAGTDFYTMAGGYNFSLKDLGLSAGLMCNYSQSQIDSLTTEIVGPSMNLSKTFLERKLRTSLSYSYNYTSVNKNKEGDNSILRAAAAFNSKVHTISLNGIFAFRKRPTNPTRTPDVTVTLTYSYNFGFTPFGKKETPPANNL